MIFNVMLGLLLPIYIFFLGSTIAAYRTTGDRRILLASLIFLFLLIKSIFVVFRLLSGESPQTLLLLIDVMGIVLVILLWKWRG